VFVICAIVCSSSDSFSQSKWSIEAYINPFVTRIGNNHVVEYGLGYYNFKEDKKYQWELGSRVNYNILLNFDIGFGLGLKNMYYNFTYTLTNPIKSDEIIQKTQRELKLIMLSPAISFRYRVKRFSALIGLEFNEPISSVSNYETVRGELWIFIDIGNQVVGYYSLNELPQFSTNFSSFIVPEIRLGYRIMSRLYVHVGMKLKPYGSYVQYYFLVQGNTGSMGSDKLYDLNDTRVNNRMTFLYIGASYTIGGDN